MSKSGKPRRVTGREAAAAQKAAERERRQLEKQLEARVAEVEKSLPVARATAARAADETPSPEIRQMARSYLRGHVPADIRADAPGAAAHVRGRGGQRLVGLPDRRHGGGALGWEQIGPSPLYDRVDAVESTAWGEFIVRLRRLAGEA